MDGIFALVFLWAASRLMHAPAPGDSNFVGPTYPGESAGVSNDVLGAPDNSPLPWASGAAAAVAGAAAVVTGHASAHSSDPATRRVAFTLTTGANLGVAIEVVLRSGLAGQLEGTLDGGSTYVLLVDDGQGGDAFTWAQTLKTQSPATCAGAWPEARQPDEFNADTGRELLES